MKGTVKWFSKEKGYGFITPEGAHKRSEDVFVHHTEIEQSGFRALDENQAVEFELIDGEKGRQAAKVRKLENGNS